MAQAVSRRPLTAEAQASPRGICKGQNGNGTGVIFRVGLLSFPLSVPFHHCSMLVRSATTDPISANQLKVIFALPIMHASISVICVPSSH
jgi:hypothetical protein